MKTQTLMTVFIVLITFSIANSQSIFDVITDVDFAAPEERLYQGKLMVQDNSNTESVVLATTLGRWPQYNNDNSNITVQGKFILDIGGGEIDLSDSVSFSNNDFSPSFAVGSSIKWTTITFAAHTVKAGHVKFKYRGKNNVEPWSQYRYSSKSLQTTFDSPGPELIIQGPNILCNSQTYSIADNDSSISFKKWEIRNGNSIRIDGDSTSAASVTLVKNNNSGQVDLVAVFENLHNQTEYIYSKTIRIGEEILDGMIVGTVSMEVGTEHIFQFETSNGQDYGNITWQVDNPNIIVSQQSSSDQIKLIVPQNFPFTNPQANSQNITLTVSGLTDCGIASQSSIIRVRR
ncbi:hypothetical protein SAMN05421747_13313 [Parapedobacter composti]|uniref:Uncharacterized protein n=1 Tax=Parapedobacter composti TaxID=623281 RepID=A0A1I1MJH1_9SPHI|nr:hypothetical protein [Parapedobacter composti]SFC83278.1 hypothetical protein SAMN05421747_13313 [Parapedobacter composti]